MTRKKQLIIIGGVAAGVKAAARARRVNQDLDITLFESGADVSYSACGEPYYISGVIPKREHLVIRRPEEFLKDNIKINIYHQVTSINSDTQTLVAVDTTTRQSKQYHYDQLIIATGAQAVIPPIPGCDLQGVVSLRTLNDSDRLRQLLLDKQSIQAVIVGSGYIGLELAESLKRRGAEVSVIDFCHQIFPRIDPLMSELIQKKLLEKGVNVFLNESIDSIQGQKQTVESIKTQSGQILPCNLVIMACGVKPNVSLALQSGIKLGSTGAIAVNQKLQTNVENIYAAGDCVESRHRISGLPAWLPLGDIANLQGRVAGENTAGGNARFPGILGTSIFRCFDLQIGMTGLTDLEIKDQNIDCCETVIHSRDRARYYPDGQTLSIKLTAQKSNGKILGAQAVGQGGVAKIIDISATALLGNLSCFDLEFADLAYAPPFSPVLSPMIIAASELRKKINL